MAKIRFSYIRQQLAIRFCQSLYENYQRGSCFHFYMGIKRIVIEILKSVYGFFYGVFYVRRFNSPVVGLWSTINQKKSLLNAKNKGVVECELFELYSISKSYALARTLCWLLIFFSYPVLFFFKKDRVGSPWTLAVPILVYYNRILLAIFSKKKVKRLIVSNDHSGDIYLLCLINRDTTRLPVDYVQHGAVKESFPTNYFENIFIYDQSYYKTYKKLSLNPRVNIRVCTSLNESLSHEFNNLTALDAVLMLSHAFNFWSTISALLTLRRCGYLVNGIRFHPSDRFAKIKYRILRFFFTLEFCDSFVGYEVDINRSKIVIAASSSILKDAYDKGISDNIIWLKSIGLKWDYYNLVNKIKSASNSKELFKILTDI